MSSSEDDNINGGYGGGGILMREGRDGGLCMIGRHGEGGREGRFCPDDGQLLAGQKCVCMTRERS